VSDVQETPGSGVRKAMTTEEKLERALSALREIRSWRGTYHGPEHVQEIARAAIAEIEGEAK